MHSHLTIFHLTNIKHSKHSNISKLPKLFLFNTPIPRPTTRRFLHTTMAAVQYAKDQPAGFKNRIEKVAIIGVSFDSLGCCTIGLIVC